MNNVNKENKGNPLLLMKMKAELGKIKQPLPSMGYKMQFNVDSTVYEGMGSEDTVLVFCGLKIETGITTNEDTLSVLPDLLKFLGKYFPNLELLSVQKIEHDRILLDYWATEMNHYSSLDWLMKVELEEINEPLMQVIVENSLKDMKLGVEIAVNY